MNAKERRFCEFYVQTLDGVKAAAGAQYKDPKKAARDLLSRVDILRTLELRNAELQASIEVNTPRLIQELHTLAFSDIGDFFEFAEVESADEGANPTFLIKPTDWNRVNTAALSQMELTNLQNGDQRTRVKLHPKLEALKLLAQHKRLFAEEGAGAMSMSFNFFNGPAPDIKPPSAEEDAIPVHFEMVGGDE